MMNESVLNLAICAFCFSCNVSSCLPNKVTVQQIPLLFSAHDSFQHHFNSALPALGGRLNFCGLKEIITGFFSLIEH